jgi:catechol 2,3-dioxygenase-like lactoylglutathione lyase family enzyme
MMTITRMTPNLYTADVAMSARFWTERLGFEKTVEVPEDGGKLAFVALQKGQIELMYGSYASLEREPRVSGAYQKGTGFLFIEVDDIRAALAAVEGAPVVAELHETFYGATEFTVKDPAGHLLTFAQFAKK